MATRPGGAVACRSGHSRPGSRRIYAEARTDRLIKRTALTETGRQVLALYRQIEAASAEVNANRLSALRALLPDVSSQK